MKLTHSVWLLLLVQLPILHSKMTLCCVSVPWHGDHAGSTDKGTAGIANSFAQAQEETEQ